MSENETTRTLRNLCCLVAPQMADVIRATDARAIVDLAKAIELIEFDRISLARTNHAELCRAIKAAETE